MAQAHSQQRATVWMNDKDVLWRMCITNPYSYILKKREREKGKKEIKIIDNSYFSTQENSSYFTG